MRTTHVAVLRGTARENPTAPLRHPARGALLAMAGKAWQDGVED